MRDGLQVRRDIHVLRTVSVVALLVLTSLAHDSWAKSEYASCGGSGTEHLSQRLQSLPYSTKFERWVLLLLLTFCSLLQNIRVVTSSPCSVDVDPAVLMLQSLPASCLLEPCPHQHGLISHIMSSSIDIW
jgi:hypothetical protein